MIYGNIASIIYVFLMGLFCGHILAGFCYSSLIMDIEDYIEKKIREWKEKRKQRKEAEIFEKQKQEYLKTQRKYF